MSSSSDHSLPCASEAATPREAVHRPRTRAEELLSEPTDLKPIGPERLLALREAIRNGTYPSGETVERGLTRMFLWPAGRRRSS